MSAPRKRSRRPSSSRPAPSTDATSASVYVPPPMPEWKWKTFPVYFAFSIGGFIGLYFGVIVAGVDNSTFTTVVFIGFALLLGFGLSRISTRFLISRRWVKPRPRRKR